jgi:ribokinase
VFPSDLRMRRSPRCPPIGADTIKTESKALSRVKIVVVGSVNMDLIVTVNEFARPGETIMAHSMATRLGGKGANQAVAASRLGADVTMFGLVGTDAYGSELVGALASESVDVNSVQAESHSSGVAIVTIDAVGENTVMVVPGANGQVTADHLAGLGAALSEASFLVLQLEIPASTVLWAAQLARSLGVPIMLNAAPLNEQSFEHLVELLRIVDVLVVNETEARALGAHEPSEEGAAFLRRRGPIAAVITLGSQGAVYAAPSGVGMMPAIKVESIDTVGAGDTFCAELAVALAEGASLDVAVMRGNVAGALATTKWGSATSTPTRLEADTLWGSSEKSGLAGAERASL